jgi:hypothetical protein
MAHATIDKPSNISSMYRVLRHPLASVRQSRCHRRGRFAQFHRNEGRAKIYMDNDGRDEPSACFVQSDTEEILGKRLRIPALTV